MKKAFTLIELLVVIAIIAILAAILFPVFAQARVAAKKTVAISNQKQISLGMLLYTGDFDDQYPRRSGCEFGSSINPALNTGTTLRCSSATGFAHSMTWQTWQKYINPYIKSVDIFFHPLRQRDQTEWTRNGQIRNGFILNLGLTGAATTSFITTPWTGGTQAGIPNPASAVLLLEHPLHYAAPQVVNSSVTSGTGPAGETLQTGYTLAVREYWASQFMRVGTNPCQALTPNVRDAIGSGPAGGVVMGMADGSARFVSVEKFLADTPSSAQYLPGAPFPAGNWASLSGQCRTLSPANVWLTPGVTPRTDINFPLWGLGQ